jgi:exosortase
MTKPGLAPEVKPSNNRWYVSAWDVWVFFVPLLGMLPLLYLEGLGLWSRPHMHFSLMVVLAMVVYAVSGFKESFAATPWRWSVAILLVVLGQFAHLYAVWLYSPWVAHFGLLLVFVGWGLVRRGESHWSRVLAWGTLILITIPLPLNQDQNLIGRLQQISSVGCSAALDTLAVPHLREGNTITLKAKRLFVDEACSGVGSLYSLLATALFLLVFNQRSLWVGLLTLLTVPAFAVLGNFLRLLAIALGLEWYGFDWSFGAPHERLGFVTFGIAALCLWSAEWMIGSALAPIPLTYFRDHRAWNPDAVRHYLGLNRLLAWPGESSQSEFVEEQEAAVQPKSATGLYPWQTRWSMFLPLAVLASTTLAGGGLVLWVMKDGGYFHAPTITAEIRTGFPGKDSLPKNIDGWELIDFQEATRSQDDIEGAASQLWTYRKGDELLRFSLDFPFRGFHPLWMCYVANGWRDGEKSLVEGTWSSLENDLFHELRGSGYLLFGFFDEWGDPYPFTTVTGRTAQARTERNILGRIQVASAVVESLTYQCQIFREVDGPLSPAQREEMHNVWLRLTVACRDASKQGLEQIRGISK